MGACTCDVPLRADELVPEADPEHGRAPQEVAHDLRLGLQRLGVAGAVREDDPVEPRELVGGRRMRADGHRGSRGGEPPHDRALGAVVDDGDARAARLGEDVRLGRGHLRHERLTLHRRLRVHLREGVVGGDDRLVRDGRSPHGAGIAQAQDERARVDPVEPDETVGSQPLRPLAPSERAHEDRTCVWLQ